MAAFSSNIDITSGGTYSMDIVNGEPSSQVASDLNGKFSNIQSILQGGLPETFTGGALPDTLQYGKLMLYNNQWYYGNQHNEPTLVSTSKEINLVQANTTTQTGTFSATSDSTFEIQFTSRPDYYTFPIQYWNFTNLSTSTITSYTSGQNKRLGLNFGTQSAFSLITFNSSNTATYMVRRILIMPTNISMSSYSAIIHLTNAMAENYSATSYFTDSKIEEVKLDAPVSFSPIITGCSVSCKSISIQWCGAKFEY